MIITIKAGLKQLPPYSDSLPPFSILLFVLAGVGAVLGLANNLKAEPIGTGKLRIGNYVYNNDFIRKTHNTLHYPGCTEGYDEGWDFMNSHRYNLETEIISKNSQIAGYELDTESRPLESLTPVDLELSLYSISGSVIMDNENELWISLPFSSDGWDFGKKPITLWEKTIIDPNNNPNDPNNYTASFLADIREAIDKSDFYTTTGKTAKIPIQKLQGTFYNNNTYMYAQTRFDVAPVDQDLDRRVDANDFAYFGADWKKTAQPGETLLADTTGPAGIPDKTVDIYDLKHFARYWLFDSNDQSTW